LQLPRRITQGLTGSHARDIHVEIKLVDRGIAVRALPGYQAWVVPVDKCLQNDCFQLDEQGRIVPQNGWIVLFDPPDQPQRVAVLGRNA